MILVGDIGGTHARLALADADGGEIRIDRQQVGPTPEDLPALIRRYLDDQGIRTVAALALCGAGPTRDDGSIRLTNHPCVLEPASLGRAAGAGRVIVVNDFAAVAHAIPALRQQDLLPCGGGQPVAGAPCVAIGAGTGLGIAALVAAGDDWVVVPGEGGHADLAPVDDEELAAWSVLRLREGRISAEMVLSGRGLERLHNAVGGAVPLDAPYIARAAAQGDVSAARAVRLFTRWLGRVAGNATLTVAARGGVYIAGGIVPAWGSSFDIAAFRAGFEDKAPFADWLARIPAFVVLHPQPAFLGLARLALAGALQRR